MKTNAATKAAKLAKRFGYEHTHSSASSEAAGTDRHFQKGNDFTLTIHPNGSWTHTKRQNWGKREDLGQGNAMQLGKQLRMAHP